MLKVQKLVAFSAISLCVLLSACEEKELKPGEAEWLAVVEQLETVQATGDPLTCGQQKELYKEAEETFKVLLKSLQGMQIRSRDQRMGVMKEYIEDNC